MEGIANSRLWDKSMFVVKVSERRTTWVGQKRTRGGASWEKR